MATFRCLQSGNTVTFKHQVDIDSMQGHTGYVRIDGPAEEEPEVVRPIPMIAPPAKRMGRPRKPVPSN